MNLDMQRADQDFAELDEPSLGALTMIPIDDPKPPITNATSSSSRSSTTSTDDSICVACGYSIIDRYLYKVRDEPYHEQCLRCVCCHRLLSDNPKCYSRHGSVYCQHDHQMLFGKRCRRCLQQLQQTDIVFKVHYMVYHHQCFSCYGCRAMFNKGDQYHFLDGEIFCPDDYQNVCQLHAASVENNSLYEEAARNEGQRKTPKRPRTILNAQQRRQFKSAFDKSSKPSRKVREQLAKETGLSVRVVQVWFQNQRAKMKKMVRKEGDSSSDIFAKGGANSEGRSTEEMRSSDDEESIFNMDADEIESTMTPSYTNPIQKLYNMTSSQLYFPYNS